MMTNGTIIRTYSELITLPTFIERFRYLKLDGVVGESTFGHERHLNQVLYSCGEWKKFRRDIILRDKGYDLGCKGFDIASKILVHHINPITVQDVLNRSPMIFDPENVITTCFQTHNAIHYGDESLLYVEPVVRKPNDTCPWKG